MAKCRHDVLSDCPACMQDTIDALVEALKMARNRIAVLGPFTATRHFDANEKVFLPKIDAILAAVGILTEAK